MFIYFAVESPAEVAQVQSPVRKEMKTQYEQQLRKELDQWVLLMNEPVSCAQRCLYSTKKNQFNLFSLISQNNFHIFSASKDTAKLNDFLKPDQISYLDAAIDIPKAVKESNEFRTKIQYLVSLHAARKKAARLLKKNTMNKLQYQTCKLHIDSFASQPLIDDDVEQS